MRGNAIELTYPSDIYLNLKEREAICYLHQNLKFPFHISSRQFNLKGRTIYLLAVGNQTIENRAFYRTEHFNILHSWGDRTLPLYITFQAHPFAHQPQFWCAPSSSSIRQIVQDTSGDWPTLAGHMYRRPPGTLRLMLVRAKIG